MIGNRHTIAWYHKDFYRNCYHKTLAWLLVTMFIILLLIGAIIYVFLTQPGIKYYASTTNGQIIPMIRRH